MSAFCEGADARVSRLQTAISKLSCPIPCKEETTLCVSLQPTVDAAEGMAGFQARAVLAADPDWIADGNPVLFHLFTTH